MWQKIIELSRLVFNFGDQTRQNTEDIRELQREVQRLSRAVELLATELRHVRDQERVEREKLALQMENELLRRLGPRP